MEKDKSRLFIQLEGKTSPFFLYNVRREIRGLVTKYSSRSRLIDSISGMFDSTGVFIDQIDRQRQDLFQEKFVSMIRQRMDFNRWRETDRMYFLRCSTVYLVESLAKRWSTEEDKALAANLKLMARRAVLFALKETERCEQVLLDESQIKTNYTGMSKAEIATNLFLLHRLLPNPPPYLED